MNPFDSTPNDPARSEEKAQRRALPSSLADSSTSPPLRGEIFDVIIGEGGEIESPPATRKNGAAWFLAALAALFCAYSVGAYVGQKSKIPAPTAFSTTVAVAAPLRVQVAGQVKKPGVYTLKKGARLEDALQKAGGALAGADLSALNLADWAADGSKIEVPAKTIARPLAALPTPTPRVIIKKVFVTLPQNSPADKPDIETQTRAIVAAKTGSTSNSKRTIQPDSKRDILSAPGESKTETGGKSSDAALALLRKNPIDLNRANAEQLATLPGVGPKMAERILIYRKENGGFKSIEDLDNVRGIGEKRMETLRDLVKVK